MKDMIPQWAHAMAIDPNDLEYKPMGGGTSNKVGIIQREGKPAYVMKMNDPGVIALETQFLEYYRGVKRLPHVIYTDPSHRFFVYEYIPGETSYRGKHKRLILRQLLERVMVHYRPVPNESGWGRLEELRLLPAGDYDEKRMCEEVLIGLHVRIALCIKYHSYDLKAYLAAWSDWKSRVLQAD